MNSCNQFHAIKIIRYVVIFVFKNKFNLNLTNFYFNTKKNQPPTLMPTSIPNDVMTTNINIVPIENQIKVSQQTQ